MPKDTIPFKTRFLASVDRELRTRTSRRGELLDLVLLVLKTVDLSTIPLLNVSSEKQVLAVTNVNLPSSLHARLKEVAEQRQSSMNALVNSAVWAYTRATRPKK